jgi:hypothetical protein
LVVINKLKLPWVQIGADAFQQVTGALLRGSFHEGQQPAGFADASQ